MFTRFACPRGLIAMARTLLDEAGASSCFRGW